MVILDIETEDFENLTETAWKASAVYERAGQPDQAASILEKAAKTLEEKKPDFTTLMLNEAAKIVEIENRPIQAAFYINKILQLRLKTSDLIEACKCSEKMVQLYQDANHMTSSGRSVCMTVLILVDLEKLENAEKFVRMYENNCSHDQIVALDELIFACERKDSLKVNLKAYC